MNAVKTLKIVLGVGIFFISTLSLAASLCASTFLGLSELHDLDSLAGEKLYYKYTRQYGKSTPQQVTVTGADGKTMQMATPPQFRHLLNPTKNLDTGIMGILGKVFDVKWNPESKSIAVSESDIFFDEQMTKTIQARAKASKTLEPAFSRLIEQVLAPEEISPGVIMIRFKNFNRGESPSPLHDLIRNRFGTLYLHLANWSYRLSGLEKNKALSNLTMIDEMVQLIQQGKAAQFQLTFDKKVWQAHLELLQELVHEYQQDLSSGKQTVAAAERISSPDEAFLPFSGIMVSFDFMNPKSPVEMKRYFKNDLEDPFHLLGIAEKNEFRLRHQMIYRVIETLAPGQEIEIHAHSLIHVRAYKKLGFVDTGLIENPKYPGVEIHLLKASREVALAKIQAILDKTE